MRLQARLNKIARATRQGDVTLSEAELRKLDAADLVRLCRRTEKYEPLIEHPSSVADYMREHRHYIDWTRTIDWWRPQDVELERRLQALPDDVLDAISKRAMEDGGSPEVAERMTR